MLPITGVRLRRHPPLHPLPQRGRGHHGVNGVGFLLLALLLPMLALPQTPSDGTVASFQKISDTAGNFTATLDNSDVFGFSVASVGDLDGDSVPDLAVGAFHDSEGGSDL